MPVTTRERLGADSAERLALGLVALVPLAFLAVFFVLPFVLPPVVVGRPTATTLRPLEWGLGGIAVAPT